MSGLYVLVFFFPGFMANPYAVRGDCGPDSSCSWKRKACLTDEWGKRDLLLLPNADVERILASWCVGVDIPLVLPSFQEALFLIGIGRT